MKTPATAALSSTAPSRAAMGPWSRILASIAALLASLVLTAQPVLAEFDRDLQALTAAPHRLSGSPEGRAAADYVEARLREIGVPADQVYPLEMVVWQTEVKRCELLVGGKSIPMLPLQPNLIVPPVTPPGGLVAPSMYVGDGSILAYGSRRPETGGRGKVVVMDYDSVEGWQTAFALGADAVVFIGDPDDPRQTPRQPRTLAVPANLLRFYISAADLRAAGVDLTRDQDEVTIHSEVIWQKQIGRNVVGRIRGADPTLGGQVERGEAIVLAANLDSFGAVPHLSPGARGAANVAALLETAEALVKDPPARDVLVMFVDNQARLHQGAREVYEAILMPQRASDARVLEHREEQAYLARLRDGLLTGELADPAESAPKGHRAPEPALTLADQLSLAQRLEQTAEHMRDDISQELQMRRLAGRGLVAGSPQAMEVEATIDRLEHEQMRWDDIRRALHNRELPLFVAMQRAILDGGTAAAPAAVVARPEWLERYKAAVREFRTSEAEVRPNAVREAEAYLGQLTRLRVRTETLFNARLGELETELRIDAQRTALRTGLRIDETQPQLPVIALHVAYDFSGDAPTWGVVVGDWTDRLFRPRLPKPEGNQPGYYGPTLQAFAGVLEGLDGLRLDTASLRDPLLSAQLCPRPFVTSGYVAGMHGHYHVTLMTAYDARLRDGHPADTVAHLNLPELRAQAGQATRVIARLASSPALTRPQVFKPFARTKYPTWSNGRSSGDYAGEQVTGSLSENRPAAGAMIALWPGRTGSPPPLDAWDVYRDAMQLPQFQPIAIEAVDANGRFRVLSLEETMNAEVMTLGALFDERGEVRAISTRRQQAQRLANVMRVDLFAAKGFVLSTIATHPLRGDQLKVLKGNADAPFRDTRSLVGQVDGTSFWYLSGFNVDDPVKVFQPMGPVALNIDLSDERNPSGVGLPPSTFLTPPRLAPTTAEDLWELNETRLAQLRQRGVTSADLEDLHSEAKREREAVAARADELPLATAEAGLQRAAVLSHRVYAPLRQAMDDLVHAIVMLLLLAIPFAFALERLLICAPTIYGRIAGFATIFLVTFALLYFTHPGFAIASTPIIIFLAFTIILLSSLVIYIVVRKFRTELKAMQGQAVGLHDIEVSSAGTLLAAVNMGMSTMRRRPTRTGLTAVTVVVLTFTILCFASFTRTIGVRAIPAGLKHEATAPGLLLRNLDYSKMPPGMLAMLQGVEGEGGLLSPQWWLARTMPDEPPFSVTNPGAVEAGAGGVAPGPYAVPVDAVMGLSLEELTRWYEFAAALGAPPMPSDVRNDSARRAAFVREHAAPIVEQLRGGGVFLPPIVQDMLRLTPGQPILLQGTPAVFAGTFDGGQLQRLRHLDGDSVLPVDFTAAGAEAQAGAAQQQASEQELVLAEDVEKDFVHLSADQVAIASADLVRRMGGNMHLIAIYPGRGSDGTEVLPERLGEQLARIVVMPIWAAGREGVQRMLLTVLTEVSGGLALGVPLVLGGLIIFGTLLGSIQDREKEIYTFSALGLSPTHVGVLFFAEAAVYAVVGGMGGQLVAQFVALAAGWLARAGYIDPANINYSSTNALFAIGVVMATVLVSAIYPAVRASRSANPGLARAWKMPPPVEDDLTMKFPFTVSAYDITGVISFLAEHFRRHDDAGLGTFAADNVRIRRTEEGHLELSADLALAPFDLGVTQHLTLTAVPSEIEGVDEVAIHAHRLSGAKADWLRSNRTFLKDLRKQFLLWRTLSSELIEKYRMETLTTLGQDPADRANRRAGASSDDTGGTGGGFGLGRQVSPA